MVAQQFLLGIDVGSSSVKAALFDIDGGKPVAQATSPSRELEILSPKLGWAEQHPDTWWEHVCNCIAAIRQQLGGGTLPIKAIGIAYQMHGLVALDEGYRPVRPAIIWCDSRAVEIGAAAFKALGPDACLEQLLNSPGNFTASKLAWVLREEPQVFSRIRHICLPGDYIALKLTGELSTSVSGLSEGIMWNFSNNEPARFLLDHYGISSTLIPEAHSSFAVSGQILPNLASELGIDPSAVVSYRAGDQPNNAFSLQVLEPGEVAATAGTSGVVYGVTEQRAADKQSRVNTFVHVTNQTDAPRYGVLLCINGTGSLNRWLKDEWGGDYATMNDLAASSPVGSRGVSYLPYGNGAERTLMNRLLGAALLGLDLNTHKRADIFRSAQEGIAFAMRYGFEALKSSGVTPSTIRAGRANMFLSPVFQEAFTNALNVPLELFATDGAQGAARGAGIGAGIYRSVGDAFNSLKALEVIRPTNQLVAKYEDAYQRWVEGLQALLNRKSS